MYSGTDGGVNSPRPIVIADPSNGVTLSYWIRTSQTVNDKYPVVYNRKIGDNQNAMYLGYNGGNNATYINIANNDCEPSDNWAALVTDGEWHHVALVYDPSATGAEGKLYIDNDMKESWNISAGAWDNDEGSINIDGDWDGQIDELLLQNSAITDFSNAYGR